MKGKMHDKIYEYCEAIPILTGELRALQSTVQPPSTTTPTTPTARPVDEYHCRVSLGSESRKYEFPSGNFRFLTSEVVITSRKVGQADSSPSFPVLSKPRWRIQTKCKFFEF